VPTADRWRARATTLEAAALLAAARMLIAIVPFGRWRAALGQPCPVPPSAASSDRPADNSARLLVKAVGRAAERLPGGSRCLPQAMALQWLLRRRNLGGILVIGAKARTARGTLDDLHAWVIRDGTTLIGRSDDPYVPIYAAIFQKR
jgi:hypothetical protein